MRTGRATRREFLKGTAAAGAAGLLVSTLDFGRMAPSFAATMDPPGGWSDTPGQARYRIDGLAKVTGQKIYARDFQPIDLPDWPTKYRHALVVCAPFVDYVYDGLDLDQLPKALQPSVVITAADLARDSIGIAEEDYPEGEYLVATGKPPTYLGQAVAILLYDELTAYNGAKEQIVSDGKVIRRGKAVTPPDPVSYEPETSIVHAVTRESGDQHFAQTLHGPVHPSQPGAKNKKAMQLVDKIGERLQSPDLDVFHQTYETPVIDPMFMEPETGLAWFDRKAKTLRLLIGTQSPGYDVTSARALFAPKACPNRDRRRPSLCCVSGRRIRRARHLDPVSLSRARRGLFGHADPHLQRPVPAVPGWHQASRVKDRAYRRRQRPKSHRSVPQSFSSQRRWPPQCQRLRLQRHRHQRNRRVPGASRRCLVARDAYDFASGGLDARLRLVSVDVCG